MTSDSWVLATDTRRLAAMVAAARGAGGRVNVAAIGLRSLADAAAAAGPDAVSWVETDGGKPPEAYAQALAASIAVASPRVLVAATTAEGRVLLATAATALGAAVVPGLLSVTGAGDTLVVERVDLGGRVLETLATAAAVAGLFGGDDVAPPEGAPAPVTPMSLAPAAVRVDRIALVPGATGGVTTAERVVSVGRGVKARADLKIVEGLAADLGAEIACSMPIADDFGWVAKERYIGRSGQHIAPRLYVALGISGTPQHLEGVRDAKVVVAVNTDPDAHIFRRADYGIVGDLYEVIPALRTALGK